MDSRLIPSAVSAVIAELVTLPVCTIKTVYQNTERSQTISDTIKQIYGQSGIRGFYRSSGSSILLQGVSTTLKFTMYRYLNCRFEVDSRDKMAPSCHGRRFVHGAIAGFIASLVTHPIQVLKIYNQMNQSLITELRIFGPRILYRGYSKTLIKTTLSASLYFPLYDIYYAQTHRVDLAAIASAATSCLIIHPFDYFRTRQIYNKPLFQGWHLGIYYRGLSLNLLRTIPHFVIFMSVAQTISISKPNSQIHN